MFFSAPDWSIMKKGQKMDSKISLQLNLQNMLKEEEVKEKIKNRTRAKKIELIIVRVISMIVNAALLGGSWVAIFYVNVY